MPAPPNATGISDADVQQDPTQLNYVGGVSGLPGMVKKLAYGGNISAPSTQADSRLYRLERGAPFKRSGHMVTVMPQFRACNVTIGNLASQPNGNRSVSQIVQPTVDPSLTNSSAGTPFIGWPGANRLNLT